MLSLPRRRFDASLRGSQAASTVKAISYFEAPAKPLPDITDPTATGDVQSVTNHHVAHGAGQHHSEFRDLLGHGEPAKSVVLSRDAVTLLDAKKRSRRTAGRNRVDYNAMRNEAEAMPSVMPFRPTSIRGRETMRARCQPRMRR